MPKPQLTDREIDVLKLVVEGLSNQQIADELHIARRTAQSHVSSCLRKLGARSRTQLAVRALREGIVPLHPEDAEAQDGLDDVSDLNRAEDTDVAGDPGA